MGGFWYHHFSISFLSPPSLRYCRVDRVSPTASLPGRPLRHVGLTRVAPAHPSASRLHNKMASERLDSAEKIVRMTEWNESEAWEYSEDVEGPTPDNLAMAKRFLAAQSFLLSWQEGKVPTGWKRPRRLTDFDGKYPSSVLEKVEGIFAERIAVNNFRTTAMLKDAISARDRDRAEAEAAKTDKKDGVTKIDVEALKSDFAKFNNDFFEVKSALSKATAATAEVSLQIQALSEALN